MTGGFARDCVFRSLKYPLRKHQAEFDVFREREKFLFDRFDQPSKMFRKNIKRPGRLLISMQKHVKVATANARDAARACFAPRAYGWRHMLLAFAKLLQFFRKCTKTGYILFIIRTNCSNDGFYSSVW